MAQQAPIWPRMQASTNWPSQAQPKLGAKFIKPAQDQARNSASNWVANRLSSSLMMPISTALLRAWLMRFGSIKGRSVARGHACWCRTAWPMRSMPKFARGWQNCAWVIRWINPLISARWSMTAKPPACATWWRVLMHLALNVPCLRQAAFCRQC